ncbi:MAG: hypothetical protein LC778_10360 [Acidobacteria bacterium]|nr:hypothetical protein [Acidobacteriota bacterium]
MIELKVTTADLSVIRTALMRFIHKYEAADIEDFVIAERLIGIVRIHLAELLRQRIETARLAGLRVKAEDDPSGDDPLTAALADMLETLDPHDSVVQAVAEVILLGVIN